jgi:hypothetical protein
MPRDFLIRPRIPQGAAAGLVPVAAADGSMSWAKVGTAGIADNAIGAAQIADGTVGSAELANASVIYDKLAYPFQVLKDNAPNNTGYLKIEGNLNNGHARIRTRVFDFNNSVYTANYNWRLGYVTRDANNWHSGYSTIRCKCYTTYPNPGYREWIVAYGYQVREIRHVAESTITTGGGDYRCAGQLMGDISLGGTIYYASFGVWMPAYARATIVVEYPGNINEVNAITATAGQIAFYDYGLHM